MTCQNSSNLVPLPMRKYRIIEILAVAAILAATFFFVHKVKAIGTCGTFFINCVPVGGVQPYAGCLSSNNVNRDTQGYWASGQTTNSLAYFTGDSVWITIPTNVACNGNAIKVATLRCLNVSTGFSSSFDIYMPPCVYSARWDLTANCFETTCSCNASISVFSLYYCPPVHVCR